MSFTALTTGEITSGEPTSATTASKIKTNFDDHETRMEALEASLSQFLPLNWRVGGFYPVQDAVLKVTANSTMFIIGARILIDVAGSSGTTQIDIKKKRGAGSYTSIFTTLPSVAFGAGNDALSTNGVLDPAQIDIIAGDILRLDIKSAQVSGLSFEVRIDWDRG